MLVLDSGAVSRLSERSTAALALIAALQEQGLWPPVVPAVVLIESLRGHAGHDALPNRFLRTCDIQECTSAARARRAAFLRTRARRGSAVDALVVAVAEPGGTVLTSDPDDLSAIASAAADVHVERV